MNLYASLLSQLNNPNLTRDNRAELCCELARELEDQGNYEEARQVIGELWQRIGEHPKIQGLQKSTAAEVLLHAGILTGWIGEQQQIEKAQEIAKNLLSESISIFESLGYVKKILEAQNELSLCYWREGAYDEARIVLQGVLARLTTDSELKAKALLRSVTIERSAGQYNEALSILTEHARLFERINSHAVKGGYHNALAMIFRHLGTIEPREDYIDRAFVEYTAASYHFEKAEHKRYRAHVENNLGFLHFKAGRFKEAHEHLDRARRLLVSLKDKGTIAQVDETRARVFLAQGNYAEAEKVARSAVCKLEQGDQQAAFAEALITHGTALARLGFHSQAYATLQRAIEAAQQAGALNRAGEAALTLIEELGEHLTPKGAKIDLSGYGLEEVKRYERNLIKQTLKIANGRITHVARLLGTTHQRLSYIIENRHKDLLKVRKPVKRRPKHNTEKRPKD